LSTALALGLATGPACHKDKKTETPTHQVDKQNDGQVEGYYGQAASVIATARDLMYCVESGNSSHPAWNNVVYPSGQGIVGAKSFSSDHQSDMTTVYRHQRGGSDLTLKTVGQNILGDRIESHYVDEGVDGHLDAVVSVKDGQKKAPDMRDQATFEQALAEEARQCREALNGKTMNQPNTLQPVATPSATVNTPSETAPDALDVQIEQLESIIVDILSQKNTAGNSKYEFNRSYSSKWGMVTVDYSETVNGKKRDRQLRIRPKSIPKGQKPAFYKEMIGKISE